MLGRHRSYRKSATPRKVQLFTGGMATTESGYVVYSATLVSPPYQIQLDPSMEVSDRVLQLAGYYLPLSQRGEHRIEDEIVFSNHDGYIFHDSCGFESGGADELKIVKNFVQQKSGERRLVNRLHAIWFGLSDVHNRDY